MLIYKTNEILIPEQISEQKSNYNTAIYRQTAMNLHVEKVSAPRLNAVGRVCSSPREQEKCRQRIAHQSFRDPPKYGRTFAV